MAGKLTGDFAELDSIAESIGMRGVKDAILSSAAEAVSSVAFGQYASGVGPDGAPWPANMDGSIPLRGPTSEIVFRATEEGISAEGPDVLMYHAEKRPVFPPDGEMSEAWRDAADAAAAAVLADIFGG